MTTSIPSIAAAYDEAPVTLLRRRRLLLLGGLLALAFALPPLLGSDYWLNAILIPFLVLSLAGLGLNLLTGYFTRMKLQDLLLQLAEHHAIALLLVTHDVDEALYLSDRVLVMGSRPSGIRQELSVALPRPRDRRDPELARLKAEALTELHLAHAI